MEAVWELELEAGPCREASAFSAARWMTSGPHSVLPCSLVLSVGSPQSESGPAPGGVLLRPHLWSWAAALAASPLGETGSLEHRRVLSCRPGVSSALWALPLHPASCGAAALSCDSDGTRAAAASCQGGLPRSGAPQHRAEPTVGPLAFGAPVS